MNAVMMFVAQMFARRAEMQDRRDDRAIGKAYVSIALANVEVNRQRTNNAIRVS